QHTMPRRMNSIFKPLLLMNVLFALLLSSSALPTTDPCIWVQTNHVIVRGIQRTSAHLRIHNPCNDIPPSMVPKQTNTSILSSYCNKMFENTVLTVLKTNCKAVSTVTMPEYDHLPIVQMNLRDKRVIEWIAGAMIGGVVSLGVKSVIDWVEKYSPGALNDKLEEITYITTKNIERLANATIISRKIGQCNHDKILEII